MIFKGSEYKEKVCQNTLYVIRHSRLVQFVEPQNGADEDFVNVKFTLEEGQYGVFAHEYRPGFLNAAKKVDIFLLAIDENRKICSSWILDVKVSVGGEDVIWHLMEQWEASYRHKGIFLNYLNGFKECETIGVITRDYQAERIQKMVETMEIEIASMKKALAALPGSSIKMVKERELLAKEIQYQAFDRFQHGLIRISGKDYPIQVYKLEGEKVPYCCNMEVKL